MVGIPNLCHFFIQNMAIQWNLDFRKPDLGKNLDLRKIVATTDFLVHKLFDLRTEVRGDFAIHGIKNF